MSRARPKIAVAIFHWWMGNPWAVFWAALGMAIVVPPFVSQVAQGVDVVLALIAAAIACVSYVQGTRQMWRRSRSRAALVVALPVLLVTLFAAGVNFAVNRQQRARVYKAEIDVKALGNAVHL